MDHALKFTVAYRPCQEGVASSRRDATLCRRCGTAVFPAGYPDSVIAGQISTSIGENFIQIGLHLFRRGRHIQGNPFPADKDIGCALQGIRRRFRGVCEVDFQVHPVSKPLLHCLGHARGLLAGHSGRVAAVEQNHLDHDCLLGRYSSF